MNPIEFRLEHTAGVTICRSSHFKQLEVVEGSNVREMGMGYTWVDLPLAEISGLNLSISVCFRDEAVESLSFSVIYADRFGSGWNDWSEEKEQLRAKEIEKWLQKEGYPSGSYDWREVWTGFDSKGGCGIGV